MQSEIAFIRNKLVSWYRKHGRSFPWRTSRDPFGVLVAEIMLRRTRADQVKSVYEKMMSLYPTGQDLTKACDNEIIELLQPLGLSWRSKPFCQLVREVGEKYSFKIPENREELKKLPGVGDYVAGAVLSIAYNKQEWIVDTNIVRLFKRYFGIKTSKEGRRDKQIIDLAKIYAATRNPRTANLAILDFTALVCTPRNPKHEHCPLKSGCKYRKSLRDVP
jgi:A/G-specific adenine glycosylase